MVGFKYQDAGNGPGPGKGIMKWSGTDSRDVRAHLNGDPTMRDQGGLVIPEGDAIQVLDRWDRVVGTLTKDASGDVYLEDRDGPLASAPWADRGAVFEEVIGLVIESGLGC